MMKSKISLGAIALLLFVVQGCKDKCYNCQNVCYYCSQSLNDTICSTDFSSMETFNTIIADINSSGEYCLETSPTNDIGVCDEVDKEILESSSYQCEEN